MSFGVHLGHIDPLGGYVWGADPAALSLVPTYWSKGRKGGCLAAEVTVRGAPTHLWDVLTWLRRPVEILDDGGQELWAGFVNEVSITTRSGVEFSISLDGMANRVAVAYAEEQGGGGLHRGTTDWAEDALSVRRYGRKEYLHMAGESEGGSAVTVRDALLRAMRQPRANRTFQGPGRAEARLACLGWAETLKWRKWERTGTRVEFTDTGGADAQAVGWRLADTDVGFTRNYAAVHDLDGRLAALRVNNRIAVTGTAGGNDGEYTVTTATDDALREYTAATVSFEPENDIKDSAGGLGFLRRGALLLLMYSPHNSGVHRVGDTGDEAVEIDTGFSGFIEAEPAGPSIHIKQGNEVGVFPRPNSNEAPNALVTVTMYGYRIAQRVTLSAAAHVGRVAVQVGRVGTPADSIRLAICADSSGSPGSALAAQTVAGNLLGAEPTWVTFQWAGAGVALGAGTYWLLVERDGAPSPTAYYTVGMTSAPYEACKAYTGSAWVPNPTGAYMPFKLWTVEQTTDLIRTVAETVGELIAAVKVDDASGVWLNGEQTGDATAYDAIDKLIDGGMADGSRLFWEVTADRTLRVFGEPAYDYRPLVLAADGTLRAAGGAPVGRGVLPVGACLAIEDVPEALGLWPIPIDGAEYDAADDRLQLHPKESGNVVA